MTPYTNKHYYAAHSYMGLNYTFESPCWMLYMFDSKATRDAWMKENEYDDQGNRVAEAVTIVAALRIAPDLRTMDPHDTRHAPRRVIHL